MSNVVVRPLESIESLARHAQPWNELWSRSASVRPTARAEHLAIWHESFAADRPLLAVVVEHDGHFVAALPLVGGRMWGMSAGVSVGNAWTPAGELLVDPDGNAAAICAALLDGLRRFAPPLVSIDGLALQSPAVQAFLREVNAEQTASIVRQRFAVPLVSIVGDWKSYLASRSRNHRRQLKIIARRAAEQGGVTFERHEALLPTKVEPLLRECFELEAAGWKGRKASAVLKVPAAWSFFLRQARELASAGELSIAALRHQGRLIAFEYGWQCRHVRAVLKIGYDESFARLSPGQLLRYHLLSELFAEGATRAVDYVGPVSDATAAWATDRYDVGRVVLAAGGVFAAAAVTGSRYGAPLIRRLRPETAVDDFVPRGAGIASLGELSSTTDCATRLSEAAAP